VRCISWEFERKGTTNGEENQEKLHQEANPPGKKLRLTLSARGVKKDKSKAGWGGEEAFEGEDEKKKNQESPG